MKLNSVSQARSGRRSYRWTPELDAVLEEGYRQGPVRKTAAIREIVRLTGWSRQACWDRARKLGLNCHRLPKRRWSRADDQLLMSLVRTRNVHLIAKKLSCSIGAARMRLRRLGWSSVRVREGLTKNELAELIGGSPRTIQKWIQRGQLKVNCSGKNRRYDTFRISEKQFLEFWRRHPEQAPVYRWNRAGLEWLILLLGEDKEIRAADRSEADQQSD
ncbi:MAG: helix-turn-helix domain-containing protein [Acidobacteriota bacterium]